LVAVVDLIQEIPLCFVHAIKWLELSNTTYWTNYFVFVRIAVAFRVNYVIALKGHF
jgi:hypothetical protein